MRIIIIGSGLGGLSAGAMLSQRGHEVVILEQSHQIGGCLQCFEREGYRFETGMHIVGSVGEGEILNNYLKMFGVYDKLQFSRLDEEAYDIVSLGNRRYNFANGHERMIDSMLRYFPDQGANLRDYWRHVDSVAQSAPHYFPDHKDTGSAGKMDSTLFKRSLNDVIDSVVSNPTLRQVLVGNIPLYAAVKDRTPFSTHAFVCDFYNKGSYRIVGGSDNIAKAFRNVIEENGGKILIGMCVNEVCCKDGKIESVVTSEGEVFRGDVFVSDIHPANLVSMFSRDSLRRSYVERVVSLPNTIPVFSLFLSFKEGCMKYLNSNYFCYRGKTTPWTLGNCDIDEWPGGYLYMHHCHTAYPEYARSGVVLSYMPYEWVQRWENSRQGRRGADYEEFKISCAEKMLNALEESFPGIRGSIRKYYTATPLTYRDYTSTPHGSMYGVMKDITLGVAGRVSWRTKLPNLMLVGQNINAHGILGVLIGTLQVCEEISSSSQTNRQGTYIEKSERHPENNERQTERPGIHIIGGGLGGLLTGALLAKNGYWVTIVEKNRRVGGGLQMFRRGDVEYATGMHVFGGFSEGGVLERICRYLCIADKIGAVDTDADCMDELFLSDGKRIRLPHGRENYVRYLTSLYPHEGEGIRLYVDALYELAGEEMSMMNNPTASISVEDPRYLMAANDLIALYIKDPKLKGLLSYLAPLYAGIEGETPAFEHAMVNVLHIEGSSMFASGSQQMADALSRVVVDAGGEIITGEEVNRIEVKDHRAVAIETSGGLRLEVERVVSDVDPRQLLRMVTPGAFPSSFRDRLNDAPYSYSAFKLFLRFEKGKVPHVSHPRYIYNVQDDGNVWNAADISMEEWPRCAMMVTTDSGDGTASTMTVVSPMTYDWFARWEDSRAGHRPADYYSFKQEMEQRLLSLLIKNIPELEGGIREHFSSTPLTIRDYNGIYRGSMYGFHKDCNHIMYTKLSVNTKVRNLFLTGQSVNLHGMCGVAITSVMTAEAVMARPLPLTVNS